MIESEVRGGCRFESHPTGAMQESDRVKTYWYRSRRYLGPLRFTYPICWQGWAFSFAVVMGVIVGAAATGSPVIIVPFAVAALYAIRKTDFGNGNSD